MPAVLASDTTSAQRHASDSQLLFLHELGAGVCIADTFLDCIHLGKRAAYFPCKPEATTASLAFALHHRQSRHTFYIQVFQLHHRINVQPAPDAGAAYGRAAFHAAAPCGNLVLHLSGHWVYHRCIPRQDPGGEIPIQICPVCRVLSTIGRRAHRTLLQSAPTVPYNAPLQRARDSGGTENHGVRLFHEIVHCRQCVAVCRCRIQ